jgi:hypothetical protein
MFNEFSSMWVIFPTNGPGARRQSSTFEPRTAAAYSPGSVNDLTSLNAIFMFL